MSRAIDELEDSIEKRNSDGRDGKQIYDDLLSYLEHNTGGYQPPFHRQAPLVSSVACFQYKGEWVHDAIDVAVRKGDIARTEIDGTVYLGINDADALREKASSYGERRDEPTKKFLGMAYTRISQLESDDNER